MNTNCVPQRPSIRFMLLCGIIIGLFAMLFSFSVGIKIMVTAGIVILLILIIERVTKSKPDEITINLAEPGSCPSGISHYKMNFYTRHAGLKCVLDENIYYQRDQKYMCLYRVTD